MGQSNWWRPAFWQDNGLTGLGFLPKVIEDLPDYLGVFDAGWDVGNNEESDLHFLNDL
jgi:hypothetical protein